MKKCRICNAEKSPSEFYSNKTNSDGLDTRCKECVKVLTRRNYYRALEQRHLYEKQRAIRPERREQMLAKNKRLNERADNRAKALARSITRAALNRGIIERKPCEVCGDLASEIHHRNYEDPFDIQWLCLTHHRAEHGQIVTAEGVRKLHLKLQAAS